MPGEGARRVNGAGDFARKPDGLAGPVVTGAHRPDGRCWRRLLGTRLRFFGDAPALATDVAGVYICAHLGIQTGERRCLLQKSTVT